MCPELIKILKSRYSIKARKNSSLLPFVFAKSENSVLRYKWYEIKNVSSSTIRINIELTSLKKVQVKPNSTLFMMHCFYQDAAEHNSGVSISSVSCTSFCCQPLLKVPGRSYKIRLHTVLVKCLLMLIYHSKKKNCYEVLVATEVSLTFPFFIAFKMKTSCYVVIRQNNFLFSMTLSKHSHYPSK